MQNAKKIAFFGTPPFTVRFLDALYDEGFVPSLIVTNPDRPSGRGMKLTAPEPKQWGEQHGIRVLQPETLRGESGNAFFADLSKEHWDLFVVIAYGSIIPERLINLPRFGTINVHYSLLPKYRGATPVESAILNDDTETGVCIQQMRFKLDTGPVYVKSEVAIDPTDTTPVLREKLNDEALRLLGPTIHSIFKGSTLPIEQDDALATHCAKIAKEDGQISLDDDPIVLDRKFRAYVQSPGVFFITEKNGESIRVKIKAAHLEDGRFVLDTVIPENGKPLSGSDFQRWLTS
jgi:methionyl-tRNA formyltransferase